MTGSMDSEESNMKGKIGTFNQDENGIWGVIETADEAEYPYRDPGMFVKPGFDVEFELIYDEHGNPSAVEMKRPEIEYPELPKDNMETIAVAVLAALKADGFIPGTSFPMLLRDAGIDDLRVYAKNAKGFIEKYLSDIAEMRDSVKINGVAKPGVIVPQGSRSDLEFSVEVHKQSAFKEMDDETRKSAINAINGYLSQKTILNGTDLPGVLLSIGISDFHEYAKNIFDFVKALHTDVFSARSNVVVNGKNQPCIITHEQIAVAFLSDDLRNRAAAAISSAIAKNGFIMGGNFNRVLLTVGIKSFKIYSPTIDAFISKYYSGEFAVKKDVIVNSRNYPCIITRIDFDATSMNVRECSIDAKLNEELRSQASTVIRQALEENDFIAGSNLNSVLHQAGIENFKTYASTIDEFISKYFSGEYAVHKSIFINNKKYPCIITFVDFDVTAFQINKLVSKIRSHIDTYDFADRSLLVSLIKEFKLDISKIASGLSEFMKQYLEDLELQKNRVIDRMIHSCVLVYKGNTNYCSLEEYDGDLILDDEIINRATTEIERIIAKNGFVPNSDIVSIFKKCGVTNLQYYADSLSDFIDKYFTVFLVKRKAYIDGEEYPSVIIRREDEKNFYYFCEDNHVILDEFFNTSDYVGFIRSPFYLKYRPTELPMGWLEKALTCAKRILTNDDTAEVNLNSFQKELIVSYSGLDFIKHNKRGGQYKVELIKECSDTFLPKRKKNQRGTVVQALNDIGGLAGGTLNYEYKGLMQRTEACWNELYPPFSLIYVLHNPGRSIDCIQEMCNKLKRSNELDLIQDDRGRWLYLPQIIEVLYKLGNLNTLPVITQTLMFATFLDFDALEEIAPISHFFSDKRLGFMLNLLDDYKKMNECDYKEAFSININRELFQKICVRLWKKMDNSETIPLEFLLLLSYVLKYDGSQSVDEIIRLSTRVDNGYFTKLEKTKLLICSLNVMSENMDAHPTLYSLGEYAANLITQMKDSEVTEMMLESCQNWRSSSEIFFDSRISGVMPVTDELAAQFSELFEVFECNYNYEMILQNAYSDWYFSRNYSYEPNEQIKALTKNHAYLAVCRLVESLNEEQTTQEILTNYLTALLFVHRYEQALLIASEQIMNEEILISVITKICLKYGVTEKTVDLITSCFSIRDAIECLMIHQTATNSEINASLVVLYALDRKPFNVYYIYNAFGERVVKGYSRILTQVLRWSSEQYGNINLASLHYKNKTTTKYTVIEKAFDYLTPENIVSLINWCSRLQIPGSGKSLAKKQTHVLAKLYDKLLFSGNDSSAWLWFYELLLNRSDLNAWKLCVTLSILEMQAEEIPVEDYDKIDFTRIEEYISWMISSTSDKEIPVNFLCILNLIFDRINSTRVMRLISDKLGSEDVKKRVYDSELNSSTNSAIDNLKQKCLSRFIKTGEIELLELAKKFDINSSLIRCAELTEIIKHNDGKLFVLKELCSAFSNGENTEDLRNIVVDISSQKTNYPTMKLLEAVKFIYSEHSEYDELIDMIESPELLDRIRKSAAKILSIYPSKQNLFTFERETFSAKYKLLVYPIVCGAIFDQDLFKQYFAMEYDDVIAENMLEIHAYFQYKVYLYEVYHNADHTFLYIERRYIKALIAKAMIWMINNSSIVQDNAIEIDDTEILTVMKLFDHYNKCFSESYTPFKTEFMKFISDETLTIEQKKHLTYALLIDNWRLFSDDIAEGRFDLPSLSTARKTISMIVQRESSAGLYQYYLDNLDNDRSKYILSASQYLSLQVYEALTFLNNDKGEELLQIICSMFETVENKSNKYGYNSFGTYIKYIFELDESVFAKYKGFFIPFMVSIQFKILLYDFLYDYTLSGKIGEAHIEILDYLAQANPEAIIIKLFLRSIRAAMQGDKISSRYYFDRHQFDSLLPVAWKTIVEGLAKYLDSDIAGNYVPVRRSGDSSVRQNRSIQVSFVRELASDFKIGTVRNTNPDELKKTKNTFDIFFKDDNVPEYDKIKAGLIYLINLNELRKLEDKKTAYQVAYLILSSSINLKPIQRLAILCDAYSLAQEIGISRFSEWGTKVLQSILNSGISLKSWCEYVALITDIAKLDNSCDEEALSSLRECIDNIAVYMAPEYPLDDQLLKLEETDAVGSIKTVYAGYLQDSINKRKNNLKSKNQLNVQIVNTNNVSTDRAIYGIIKNRGRHTVLLGDGTENTALLTVRFNQNQSELPIHIEYIRVLQSRCTTGFLVQIPMGYNDKNIDVTITVKIGSEIYSQCTKTILIEESTETVEIKDRVEWYGVKEAVADVEDMLFGRDDIKNSLRDSIQGSVSVLYGPSRIGKTSLMNWVKKKLSEEVADESGKRIITISIAPEGSARDNDYVEHFAKEGLILDYKDDKAISEYLLIDSITYGLKMPIRLTVSDDERIAPEFIREVNEILNEKDIRLSDRYANLGYYLAECDTEIWLLFDEFQKVVEKWEPDEHTMFARTLADLQLTYSSIQGIRIVLCGSDGLLKHMECSNISSWRKIINTNGIIVGPLMTEGFEQMILEDKSFAETGLSFAPEAVSTLFNYTGGIALYGKEICNAVLKRIAQRKNLGREYFVNRNTIYPYDISMATQMLIDYQGEEQRANTNLVNGIYRIYDAVVKNLEEDTDKLYLQYIAQWLLEHPDRDHFPKKCLSPEKLKAKYSDNIENSLTIVSKRRILMEMYDKSGNVYGFKFTTLFYYYAFLGINKKSCEELESILFESYDNHTEKAGMTDQQNNAVIIGSRYTSYDELDKFKAWNEDHQVYAVSSILGALEKHAIARIKGLIATKYQSVEMIDSKIVEGDDNSTNIKYDVKVIAESISSLVSLHKNVRNTSPKNAEQICVEAFKGLPIPQKISLTEEEQENYEAPADFDDNCCNLICEGVRNSEDIDIEEWLTSEVGEMFLENCGVDIEILKSYGDTHYNCLTIGLYLLYLFKGISKLYSGLDFTPASIMLCKTIERLLKEKHLPLYLNNNIWITNVKSNPSADGKRKTRIVSFNHATIGTFTTAMETMFDIQSFDTEQMQKKRNRDAFIAATRASEAEWENYYKRLLSVRDVRNDSAHSNIVTLAQCNDVVEALFKDELLAKTVEYVERKETVTI